tara:strand:+ start:8536 stop:8661 length:126 start_codon:yes stop_codon:yes gene_type:complete
MEKIYELANPYFHSEKSQLLKLFQKENSFTEQVTFARITIT